MVFSPSNFFGQDISSARNYFVIIVYFYIVVFENITNKKPFDYNIKTKHYDTGYIMSKEEELSQIKQFIDSKVG